MKLVKCSNCEKEVDEDEADRYGECRACQFADRSSDMTVGDLNNK